MTKVEVSQRWEIKTAAEVSSTDFANWQQLVEQQHQGNLMLSGSFVQHLMQVFQPEHYLASCYQGDELKVMLLLQPAKYGIWRLAQPSQAQSALIVGAQHFQPDFALLLANLPGLAWRFDFFCLDPQDHAAVIALLEQHSWEQIQQNITIDCQQTFANYLQQRPRKLRQNISRYRNRLKSESQTHRYVVYTEPTAVSAAVERYGVLESRGWKGNLGTSLDPSNQQGNFYQLFLTEQAKHGQALAIELYIDQQLAASRLCCFTPQLLLFLKTTYDENLKQLAPGRLLLVEVINYVMANQLARTIDFYTHATEEQIEWSSAVRPMFIGSFYRWHLLRKLEPTMKLIKKN